MRNLVFKNRIVILLVITGVIGGFLYWKFIGCNSGSCPITANWHTNSLAGGILGYLAGSSFQDLFQRKNRA